MRVHGQLSQWNDDRGFGFIRPEQGGKEVFVHISQFPRDGRRPSLNERLSYEIEKSADGRWRAVHVMRPGQPQVPRRPRALAVRPAQKQGRGGSILWILFIGTAIYSYAQWSSSRSTPAASAVVSRHPAASSSFSCDGRTRCSQMTSCAEARYFLQHCPGTQMDGDGDGVPCERQWCN